MTKTLNLEQTFDQQRVKTRGDTGAYLYLDRTDISFYSIESNRVCIQVTVHNRGNERSRPTTARLQVAPLGAFVAWRPLTSLDVPALDVGESVQLSTIVPRPVFPTLGSSDKNPPRQQTAVSAGDDDRHGQRPGGRSKASSLLEVLLAFGNDSKLTDVTESLAHLPDLMTDPYPSFAGNINVLIGDRNVERHMARELRIDPERTNIAKFHVGNREDDYRFQLQGSGAEWDAALYSIGRRQQLNLQQEPDSSIRKSEWISLPRASSVILAFRPPAMCPPAELDIHIAQRSTGKTAIVEFSFDPSAAGPGCHTV